VDIQNIAVEISKLRFFISLLVDYETPEDINQYEVLPNLETKFVVANALIGIDLKSASNVFIDLGKEFEELTKIFLPFTTAKTPKEKQEIQRKFEKKKEEIVNNENFEHGTDIKNMILAWNPFNVCYCSPFFDSQIMFGISEEFDVVIGNPPYVSIEGMQELDKKIYKSIYRYFFHRYDLFGCFIEKGINLLNKKGIFCFIQPSVFLNSKSFMKIREYLVNNCTLKNLNLLKDGVFEKAVVPTMIMIFSNIYEKDNRIKCSIGKLENFYFINQKTFNETEANVFNLSLSNEVTKFMNKTSYNTIPLGEIARVSRAMNVGDYSKYLVNGDEYKGKSNYIKVLKGGSINKWGYTFNNFYLLKCFDKFVSCGDLEVLNKPKLMMKRIGKIPNVCYDDSGIAGVDTIYTIRILSDSFSPLFVLALLNSTLIGHIFRLRVPLKGDVFPEFRIFDLNKQIPIKNIALYEQQPLINLVNQILLIKKENPSANVSDIENQIDKLVYELYGLTDDEIRIIEGNV
jgi:hypothetical protein